MTKQCDSYGAYQISISEGPGRSSAASSNEDSTSVFERPVGFSEVIGDPDEVCAYYTECVRVCGGSGFDTVCSGPCDAPFQR